MKSKTEFLRCLFLLFVLYILSCASGPKSTIQIEDKTVSIDQFSEEKLYPESGALIILSEASVEVYQKDEMRFSEMAHRTLVKIFNEKGYRYANVLIPYDANSKVTDIQARTILSGGQSVNLSKDQIFDTNLYPEYIFYSDLRAKRFAMPAVENGCVLEYSWKKIVNNFTFWTRWQFQMDEPVLVSKYTVRCPDNWDIHWKTYGISIEPEVEKVMKGMKADHVWKVENIPPFIPETGMPTGNNTIMSILFSPVGITRWDDIAIWFYDLTADRIKADDTIRKKTAELIRNGKTPRQKLQRIFEFVRDQIRYIAIEIGIGGYQPHFAASVFRNKYGDCKDMVILIVAMAREANIQVNPVMIPTWHSGELDTSLISPAHFNHLIAHAVLPDSSEIWMDPTEKTCPFGSLPWYDKNRLVMVISKEKKAVMKRTPRFDLHENSIQRRWSIQMDSTGRANGFVNILLKGVQAQDMRYLLNRVSSKDMENWLGRELLSRFPMSELDSMDIRGQNDLIQPLEISGTFSNAVLADREGDICSFQPGSICSYDWNRLFPEQERKYRIELQYPLEISDIAEIRIPKNFKINTLDVKDSLVTHYGSCFYNIGFDGQNRLTYQRRFQVDSTTIDLKQFSNFRWFLNQVAIKDKKTVLLYR